MTLHPFLFISVLVSLFFIWFFADANKDVLCTYGCVDALKKFGEDYSSCDPQPKACKQTKGKDECTINPAGIFEKKCPTNSDCSVKPGIKFETGE